MREFVINGLATLISAASSPHRPGCQTGCGTRTCPLPRRSPSWPCGTRSRLPAPASGRAGHDANAQSPWRRGSVRCAAKAGDAWADRAAVEYTPGEPVFQVDGDIRLDVLAAELAKLGWIAPASTAPDVEPQPDYRPEWELRTGFTEEDFG